MMSSLTDLQALLAVLGQFLSPRHKRKLLAVSLWAVALSFLEMLVAAAVLSYVQCLSGACAPQVQSAIQLTRLPVVPALSLGLFGIVALKLAVQALFSWKQITFVQMVQRDTLLRLLDGYLHLAWPAFRAENTTHYFRRAATTAIDAAYVSQQAMSLIASGLTVLVLIALALLTYPLISLGFAIGFLLVAVIMQMLLGRAQKQAAHEREAALQHWSLGMTETFGSFREIRLYGLEGFFGSRLGDAIAALARTNQRLGFVPALPRIIMDFATFASVLSVVASWLMMGRPANELLPLLVFFAVIARSILPAMMNILSTRAQVYGSVVNIELVLEEFARNEAGRQTAIGIPTCGAEKSRFTLENVSFRYASGLPLVLEDLDLDIPHPSWTALVGPSGVGKSSLIEILCGLQTPEAGRVIHLWRGADEGSRPRIGYVPQHVTLLDASIADNVVFGVDGGDVQRIEQALAVAGFQSVLHRLGDDLAMRVGPDGSRLSGGERQRLALARALYRRPDLLLLDEATSGLDEATETQVLSSLRLARPDMSVVFITHRSSNLRFADRVLRLEAGKVVAS